MTLHPLAGDLSLIDEAVVRYHAKGYDFIVLFDQFLNFREPEKKYIFSAPDYLILAEDVDMGAEGRCWRVAYAASRRNTPVKHFLSLAPYKLDNVCFSRYRNITQDVPEKNKFYSWARLERYYYGKRTKTTNTSSNATAPCADGSTATPTNSSGK
jgi:hypothetical protein